MTLNCRRSGSSTSGSERVIRIYFSGPELRHFRFRALCRTIAIALRSLETRRSDLRHGEGEPMKRCSCCAKGILPVPFIPPRHAHDVKILFWRSSVLTTSHPGARSGRRPGEGGPPRGDQKPATSVVPRISIKANLSAYVT